MRLVVIPIEFIDDVSAEIVFRRAAIIDHQTPAWFQYALHLAQRLCDIGKVVRRATRCDEIEIPVQIGKKVIARLRVSPDIDAAGLEAAALADEKVMAALVGKTVKKVIAKPKQVVNLVVE